MTTVVTLTLNPALDVSTSTSVIRPADKLRCAPERRDPGGGGINVTRVIRRLGGEAFAVYPAGGATGAALNTRLAEEGLPGACVPIEGETRESFTVAERSSGREFRFVLPGPAVPPAALQACVDAALAADAPLLVASGGLPPRARWNTYAKLARRAKREGRRLALDCAGPALRAALDEGVYLAKPNLLELEELSGRRLRTRNERLAAARALVEAGAAEIVALTLGDQGATLVTADGAWVSPPLPVAPVSSVGAGDSFLGGMLWALGTGRPPVEAFRYGMAAGAAALLSPGTELARPHHVRRLVRQVKVEAV